MGCNCVNQSITTFENEPCTELVITHEDLLSQKKRPKKSCRKNPDKRIFYLKSKQNEKKLETSKNSKSNKKKPNILSKLIKNYELSTHNNNIMIRLSDEKLNQLFDDSNIEMYYNKKSLKSFSFGTNNYIFNFSSQNNIPTSLNSTFEQTFQNTIKSENYKNIINVKNKWKINEKLYIFKDYMLLIYSID